VARTAKVLQPVPVLTDRSTENAVSSVALSCHASRMAPPESRAVRFDGAAGGGTAPEMRQQVINAS